MKAVTYQGRHRIKVKELKDAVLRHSDDILIRVTTTAICGSDLHLYNGELRHLNDDYIIGHEPMGVVVDAGPEVSRVKVGDRVIIPLSCLAASASSARIKWRANAIMRTKQRIPAVFGYSDAYGGFQGAQAELLRVPYGNVMPFIIPEDAEMEDEKLLMLSDALPTAIWSVENGGVKPGDVVIVLGCGPIGLLTQKFAWLKGAKRVIAIDHVDYRLAHASRTNHVETYNFEKIPEIENYILEITKGRRRGHRLRGPGCQTDRHRDAGKHAEASGAPWSLSHGCENGAQIRNHPAHGRIWAYLQCISARRTV